MRNASLPITLIVVGVIGVVWYLGWFPNVESVTALALVAAGVLILITDGITKSSIVLGPMLIADESRARPARPVGAPVHPAGHVQRAPRARGLRRQADDALRGDRRGELALCRQAPVALEDALLLRGRQLARVLLAEPPVARPRAGFPAARHGTEAARAPPVETAARNSGGTVRSISASTSSLRFKWRKSISMSLAV